MIRAALRTLAAAIAVASVVDPALRVERALAPDVEVRAGTGAVDDGLVRDVRERLATAGPRRESPSAVPDAVVLLNPTSADFADLPAVPLSVVRTAGKGPVEIVSVEHPRAVLPGQAARIPVEISVVEGVANVRVRLQHDGVHVAEHTMPVGARRVRVELTYAPPSAGAHPLRILAGPAGLDGQDDAVDVGLVAESRRLRVLVYETRPTWAVAFLRRALESDPALDVAAAARVSRGVDVRANDAPSTLTTSALAPYDAVLVGAPEELREAEVQALERFARERGGAVLFQPDRRPSGPYARRLPSTVFDEVLLESPAALEGPGPAPLAAELAVPREAPAGIATFASFRSAGGPKPVVFGWAVGHGRFVFSGALDAWRYRGQREEAYRRLWTGLATGLAAGAPRPIDLRVEPMVAAPGTPVRVFARLAPSAVRREGGVQSTPAIAASLIGPDGEARFVRLWPASEAGAFEGMFEPAEAGRHTVRVTAGELAAEAPMIVRAGARQPPGLDAAAIGRVVAASGGTVAASSDLSSIVSWASALGAAGGVRTYPMRSPWWLAIFVAALGAEWALRRRAGQR